jgi:hypothetical protein
MGTQMESTPRPSRSRANSHGRNAEAQPEIVSTGVIKVNRQDGEPVADERRRELIAVAAYYLAESRNFEPGHETDDWLAAEAQVSSLAAQVS